MMKIFELNKVVEYLKPRIIPGIHGLAHSHQVERNALILSSFVESKVNENVIRAFAYFHDSCRINNGSDAMHGERAAQLVESVKGNILLGLSDEEISLLKLACQLHTDVLCTCLPTIDICFDADRLDLIRCGIMPDATKMATKIGSYFANHYEEFKTLRYEIFP